MITIIQGTPGSGKSAVATVDMLEFLESGGIVACNYDLVPGWQYKLALQNPKVRLGWKNADELACKYWRRAFRIGTHDTVMQLSERLRSIQGDQGAPKIKEGMARLYLDEAQLLFNSRSWQDNMGFIEFFTQHRKLGWDVYLIAHTAEMIDKQIRGLIEYETRLRNISKIKPLGLFPIWPWPAFLAITRYAGIAAGAGEIAWKRLYRLRPHYAALYDSMEVFAFKGAARDVSHQGQASQAVKPKPVKPAGAEVWPQYHSTVRP